MQTEFLSFAPSGRDAVAGESNQFTEDAFVRLLETVGTSASSPDGMRKRVAQILVATNSHRVRDAAAVALIDLHAREEVGALLQVITRPDLIDHIGTQLFALSELGASIPLSTVVHIVEHGSYEAKAETLLIVGRGRLTVPADEKALARLKEVLARLQRSADGDVSEAAAAVLAHLD